MNLSKEQQINELNSIVKATIGVSRIEGVGVIALTNIQKGDKIYADKLPQVYSVPYGSFNKLFPYVRKEILKRWPRVSLGERFIYPDARLVSFMNFSFHPNYDAETDCAIMDIEKGQEIFEDYRIIEGWEKIYPWIKDLENKQRQRQKTSHLLGLASTILKKLRKR